MSEHLSYDQRERMRIKRAERLGLLICVAVLAAILVVGMATYYVFSSWRCGVRWPDHENKYGLISGCTVNVGGKQIPEGNVRL